MSEEMNAVGFRLRAERPMTENELAWITLIRVITDDRDPAPDLLMVQALRRAWMDDCERIPPHPPDV
ncbi:hypothetical protein [Nioella nitratireducens]|uniref:hypothetical protein n=1 Tax=Nioella nitratireducens TaxID=1287720 RepID=UPI0011BA9D83|nr:hypothetical protein [Nioella nitratireducens]